MDLNGIASGLREELQVRLDLFPDVMVGDAIRFRLVFYVLERFSAEKPRDVHRCDRARSFRCRYSHFRLVRTRLTRNFGLHARKPLVQNQIVLTHILNACTGAISRVIFFLNRYLALTYLTDSDNT